MTRRSHRLPRALTLGLGLALLARTPRADDPSVSQLEPTPRPAIEFVLDALREHELVALSESHENATQHVFLRDLVSAPRFSELCRDIVVEFATARYQDVLDRYLAGDEVPFEELARVWRDTPVSPFQTWDSPVYFAFLRAVRERNRVLPADARLRVWASEEAIPWERVETADDHRAYMERSRHPAHVTWDCALAHGRTTLLVRGGGHLTRRPTKPDNPGTLQILVEEHDVDALSVMFWDDPRGALPDVERRLAAWPVPSAASITNTWIGALPGSRVLDIVVLADDGTWVRAYQDVALEQLYDAVLYLGPSDTHELAPADTDAFTPSWREELNRRRALAGLGSLVAPTESKEVGGGSGNTARDG